MRVCLLLLRLFLHHLLLSILSFRRSYIFLVLFVTRRSFCVYLYLLRRSQLFFFYFIFFFLISSRRLSRPCPRLPLPPCSPLTSDIASSSLPPCLATLFSPLSLVFLTLSLLLSFSPPLHLRTADHGEETVRRKK